MLEVIGGALMMVGGGMLTGSSLHMFRAQRSRSPIEALLQEAFPPPGDTPPEMLDLLDQLAAD